MKMSQGKSNTMPMQIFSGVEAVYYGIVQVENISIRDEEFTASSYSHLLTSRQWENWKQNRFFYDVRL